jgi:proline iminopeptidase
MPSKKKQPIKRSTARSKAKTTTDRASAGMRRKAAPALSRDLERSPLYPPIRPYDSGTLRVSPVHTLYYEQSGNPRGKPVIFLHGGPGGGTDGKMRQFFDPKRYRIVLMDQRGCGQSLPHANLEDNTTWHLVEDIEALRRHLDIDRWQVFGGSWGSTLALAYAETHPDRVTELVLRGIFLLRRSELEWFYQNPEGAASMFPDLWEHYVSVIPESERGDMMSAYYRRLTSADAKVLGAAARAWSIWEGATSFLRLRADYIEKFEDPTYAAAFARIECHYFVNRGFMRQDDQLLADAHKIRHIPGVIVQGRYDVVCPVRSAWDLHKVWPEADLKIVADAGHSAFEPGITRELVSATDRFARR